MYLVADPMTCCLRWPRVSRWLIRILAGLLPMVTVLAVRSAVADSGAPRIVFLLNDPSQLVGVLRAFDIVVGQLGELNLEVRVLHGPRPETIRAQARKAGREATLQQARAAFWFTAETDGSIRVYTLHAATGRVYARTVELVGDAAVQREQLSVVLRAAILAVLEGGFELGDPLLVAEPHASEADSPADRRNLGENQQRGLVTEKPRASEKPPASQATVPVPSPAEDALSPAAAALLPALRAGIAYSGSTLGGTSYWQNGLLAELVWNVTGALRTSIAAGYVFPAEVSGTGASAAISRIPISARIGGGIPTGPMILGLEAGLLVEAWHRTTQVQSDTLQPTDPTTVWRTGGTVAGRLEVPVTGGVGLYLMGGAQWLPFPHRLSIQTVDAEQQLAIAAVRPHGAVGVFFGLPFAPRAGAR